MNPQETCRRTWNASTPVTASLLAVALLLCAAPLGTAAPADPADGPSQEEKLRARDLEVLEELLTTSVAEAIRTELTGGDESETWLLQISGEGWARGMFLEGYGVFFALQLPRLPIVPRFMVEGMADAQRQEVHRRLAELEVRRARLSAELAALDSPERQAEVRERLRAVDHELSALRRRLASGLSFFIERPDEDADAEERVAGEAEDTEGMRRAGAEERRTEEPRPERSRVTAAIRSGPGAPTTWLSLPMLTEHRKEAEERRRAIVTASADAVVETLGRYARVIHGLEDDDRLAVVLLPDTPQIFWRGAKPTPREEYILTVRYRDVMELDAGAIDLDEFKSRVAIHGRMGQPVDLAPSPETEK